MLETNQHARCREHYSTNHLQSTVISAGNVKHTLPGIQGAYYCAAFELGCILLRGICARMHNSCFAHFYANMEYQRSWEI